MHVTKEPEKGSLLGNRIVFLDFHNKMNRNARAAIQDYWAHLANIKMFGKLLLEPEYRFLIHSVKEMGIPTVGAYFCIKALSGGISMDEKTVNVWKGLPIEEKNELIKAFDSHIPPDDLALQAIIKRMDIYAHAVNFLFAEMRIPKNPKRPLGKKTQEKFEETMKIINEMYQLVWFLSDNENDVPWKTRKIIG